MPIISCFVELGSHNLPIFDVFFFFFDTVLEGGIPQEISEDEKVSLLTLRVQNNNLTTAVPASICELDVTTGEGELVELGVDCDICNGCSLCKGRCH